MTRMLVSRSFAQATCWIGVLQVLFGTCLALCGFIELGMFHNLSADGFWTGFPLLVPGFLAIIILATRRKEAVVPFFFANVIVLVLCIVHAALTKDEIDHWKKYKDYVINGKCYERGDICSCPGDAQTKYYVQRCDLFSFGYDLYWAFVAFDIVGVILSAVGAFAGLYGSCKETEKEEDEDPSI
ncbi:uncharacterized protein LOC135683108 isoform X2 [Rhopilema esculentum]|uniref:uncharacterized protein LOC135683108 isoform X2 n=1 Tax=Rhopilema esculentum TaxID=499914 RepID=UPI0031D2AF32